MSGKGSSGNTTSTSENSSSNKCSEYPKLVSGHQYHMYSRGNYGSERYVYLGKDENRMPEFLDYGPKSCR